MGKAGRPCTVCRGGSRDEIDAMLKAGEPCTVIGYRYAIHPSSIRRHARMHLFSGRRNAPLLRERGRLIAMIKEIDLALPERSAGQ